MFKTTPNKEVVRRICVMNDATYCYLLVQAEVAEVYVLTDIKTVNLQNVAHELESWCGIKFKVINELTNTKITEEILVTGEKIYPIQLE